MFEGIQAKSTVILMHFKLKLKLVNSHFCTLLSLYVFKLPLYLMKHIQASSHHPQSDPCTPERQRAAARCLRAPEPPSAGTETQAGRR